jgi:glycosyltransferase involved in cell wall biosynthesis
MKLLMTTDTVGGVWTYALDLARALEPHGVSIALATMGPAPSSRQQDEAKKCPNVTLHCSTFKLEWMSDPWPDVTSAGRWLLDLEQQIAPDLVHLNGYAHGALPFSAPILIVAHSCVLSWWQAVKGEPAPAEWNRYRDAVSTGLHDADYVVAPTRAMLDEIERNYGTLRRTRVIFNARNQRLYHRGTKESFILSAGRLWDQAKNIAALQAIAPRLSWPICIAGQQRSPDGASASDDGHRTHANMLCLGELSPHTLASWFSRADIYALPARYEPFGLSALEAGLSGCALVLGDIPSLRQVWGDAAFFVHPDDTEQLRARLSALIDDPKLRRAFANRAQLHASQYTLDLMGASYAALYKQVLRERAAIEKQAGQEREIPLVAAHQEGI